MRDDTGRVLGVEVEREPDFDDEQYELAVALTEYEGSLNPYGIPIAEATSPFADPDNAEGTHTYRAEPVRDWSEYAVEMEQAKPAWSGPNYLRSRRWRVYRVDR